MKPIIVYYSHSGNNEKLALKLKDKIGCEIYQINEKKKRKTISILLDFIFNRSSKISSYEIITGGYDVFIFVAPVWGSKIASPIRTFMEKEKNNIQKYFYITLCNGVDGQKDKLAKELLSITQCIPIEVKELSINSLLPEDKKNKIKHTFNYKVDNKSLEYFDEDIEDITCMISNVIDTN